MNKLVLQKEIKLAPLYTKTQNCFVLHLTKDSKISNATCTSKGYSLKISHENNDGS